jgi:predicted DsbA family dithiol-disulfide isomerase
VIVDVFHDTVCPWCRIGKKHLDEALAQWEGPEVTVRWHPFVLQPHIPPAGVEFRQHMARIKGDSNIQPLLDHVMQAGKTCGLAFDFDRVEKMPNTLDSHRLVALAPEEKQSDVLDAIHRAYFEDGRDIGDLATLTAIAVEAGLDANEIESQLAGDAARHEVEAEATWAREQGISGVPLFIFDGKAIVSGAQPAEMLLKALQQFATMPVSSTSSF